MDVPTLILMHCPLCHSSMESFNAPIGKKPRWYHRCKDCGFIFLDPRHHLLPEEEKKRYLQHQNQNNSGYREYLDQFVTTAVHPFLIPGSNILDFGSGPVSELASMVRHNGYHCQTYDPYFSPDLAWENQAFDAIIIHEVAEHLGNPAVTFATLSLRLKEHGLFLIRTRFLESCENFASWWYRMDPTHISFYSEKSMQLLMEKLGFCQDFLQLPDIAVFIKQGLSNLSVAY